LPAYQPLLFEPTAAPEPEEVKQVLNGDPVFGYVEKGHRRGENVYAALSQTNSGSI
jgi:hypothetical protein